MPFYYHNVLVLRLTDLYGMDSEHIKNSKFVYCAIYTHMLVYDPTYFKYVVILTVLFFLSGFQFTVCMHETCRNWVCKYFNKDVHGLSLIHI